MTTSLQPAYALVPGANLEAYVHTVNSIPLLTVEQERDLGERLYYEQDVEAARQMVMAHLRFVVHIARSYAGYGLAQADLIQEGNSGWVSPGPSFTSRPCCWPTSPPVTSTRAWQQRSWVCSRTSTGWGPRY